MDGGDFVSLTHVHECEEPPCSLGPALAALVCGLWERGFPRKDPHTRLGLSLS